MILTAVQGREVMLAFGVGRAVVAAGPDLGPEVQALAAGDPGALGRLYDLCAPQLYRVAVWRAGNRADAADAVQDVFVRLARNPAGLVRARDPRAYLLAMAHHAAVDRQRASEHAVQLDAFFAPAPAIDHARGIDARRAAAAIAALPPAQRATVYLHDFADLTFREIGRVTGVPTFTAASRYRLALERLRRVMGVKP